MHQIVFPERGRAVCVERPTDASPLSPDELAGPTCASVISPGTELGMQFDAADGFPHHPGYGAVFTATRLGATVDDITPGTRLFCIGPHASQQRCRRDAVVPIPPGLDATTAVLVRLLGIAWARLSLSAVRPPAPVLITGLGPVGHLAARLAALWTHPVLAVDPDTQRRGLLAGHPGIECAAAVPVDDPAWQDRPALALECSGSEAALHDCCRLVRRGSEVVVCGVPWRSRGERTLRDVMWKVFWRHLVLRGGWEWELPWLPDPSFPTCYRDNIAAGLAWLASGRIDLTGLAATVAPQDCQALYDDLTAGRTQHLYHVYNWSASD
ncbi:MAG: dehydrogenase [Planctomycetota bacterium]